MYYWEVKLLKTRLSFPFSSSKVPRIHSTTPLPFEISDGQGIHTKQVTLLAVPAKSSTPVFEQVVVQIFVY